MADPTILARRLKKKGDNTYKGVFKANEIIGEIREKMLL
jgi:hypothetical protein